MHGRSADIYALLVCLRDFPLSRAISFSVTQTLATQELVKISPVEIQNALLDTVRSIIPLVSV